MARNTEGGKSIEALRSSIEKEQRFRTAIKGYNRDDVQKYLDGLSQRYKKTLSTLDADNKRLLSENALLAGRLEKLNDRTRGNAPATGERTDQAEETPPLHRTETAVVLTAPTDVVISPVPPDSRLRKTGFSSYRRSSVDACIEEMRNSANQLKESMSRQIRSLSEECERQKAENRMLRGQLFQAEEQACRARETLAAVTGERDAAEAGLSEMSGELESVKEMLNVYVTENAGIEELKSALQQKTERLDSVSEENNRLREQIRDFSGKVNFINDEFMKYKDRRAAESAELAGLKEQMDVLVKENGELKSELEAARQELSRVSGPVAGKKSERRFREDTDHSGEPGKESGETESGEEGKEQDDEMEKLQRLVNRLMEKLQQQQKTVDRLSDERDGYRELICNLSRGSSDLHAQNAGPQKEMEDDPMPGGPPGRRTCPAVVPLFRQEQKDGTSAAAENLWTLA